MSVIFDFLSLALGSVAILFGQHRSEFAVVAGIAVVLAGLCWWGAANYSKLWNLRFRTSATQTLLCLLVAMLTFVFVILFASFKYTKDAAELSIDAWRAASTHDVVWQMSAFQAAYDAVKKLGIEDFSTATAASRSSIPLTQMASRNTLAEVYAAATVADFKLKRPFLSKIVWSRFAMPRQTVTVIESRISGYFASEGSTIPLGRVVQYTVDALNAPLREGVARVVPIALAIIVVLFVLVQLIPFSLIGWAAWRDLKVTV